MEITVDQSNLSRALRLACRALSTRAPLPILQNVLLAAEAGSLTLSSADGEIGAALAKATERLQAGEEQAFEEQRQLHVARDKVKERLASLSGTD